MTRRIRDHVINPDDDPSLWRVMLDEAGIPAKHWGAKAAAIREPKLCAWLCGTLDNAKEWLGDGVGFYLHGPLNSGKSGTAAVLAMDAIRRCETVLWLPVRDVPMVRFREGDAGKALDDRLRRADLLVLDDLGAERFRLSSAAGPALEETLRIVYDRDRTVIITSNIGWAEFTTSSPYALEAPPLVSVIKRRVLPMAIVNNQWPEQPGSGR